MSNSVTVDTAVRTDIGWMFRVSDDTGVRSVEIAYAVVPVDEPEAALRAVRRVLAGVSRF